MHRQRVLRVVSKFIVPFLLMFGLYVQLHGEYSPGGGFQAGVIIAAAFILYALIYGPENALAVAPPAVLKLLAAAGVLLYAGTGAAAMLAGGNMLDYGVLATTAQAGQQRGILLIELGVGMTVCAVMLLIFLLFVVRKEGGEGHDHT